MSVQYFPSPRLPKEIPVAGVTLDDLLGAHATEGEIRIALGKTHRSDPRLTIDATDEFQRFRTRPWTWSAMGGIEGIAVIRDGGVVFWVVTRRN